MKPSSIVINSMCEACKAFQEGVESNLEFYRTFGRPVEWRRTFLCKFISAEPISNEINVLRFFNLFTQEEEALVGLMDCISISEYDHESLTVMLAEFIIDGGNPFVGFMTVLDDEAVMQWRFQGSNCEMAKWLQLSEALQKQAERNFSILQAHGWPIEKGRILLCKFRGSGPSTGDLCIFKFFNLATKKEEKMIGELHFRTTLDEIPESATLMLVEFIAEGTMPLLGAMVLFSDEDVCQLPCQNHA